MIPQPRTMRHELNEFLGYRNGVIESSKVWKNIGCGIVAYWMIVLPERVWNDWVASIAIASALIAPDVLLKIINMKAGTVSSESRVEVTSSSKKIK